MDTEEEFVRLIETHQRILHKVARIYCRNAEDRRDLTQEMILQAWRGYANYKGNAAFSTWLYRVALNTALSYVKTEKRRLEKPLLELPNPADNENEAQDERLRWLYAAIHDLSEVEKALITLYMEEQPYQVIADILGISANLVAVRLSRIKEKLSLSIKKMATDGN